jgi:hypothetical protein
MSKWSEKRAHDLGGTVDRLVLARRTAVLAHNLGFLALWRFLIKVAHDPSGLPKQRWAENHKLLRIMAYLEVVVVEIFNVVLRRFRVCYRLDGKPSSVRACVEHRDMSGK